MACTVADPLLEPSRNFGAWLETQGVNVEVAQAMDSELGIRDYGVLRACVQDGLVRAELLATARDRLPFGFYAVLRQVVKALQGAEPRDGGTTPQWDDAALSSPGDVTLGSLVDVLLALFSGLSRELMLSMQRLGTMDSVRTGDVDSHLISPEDNVVGEIDGDAYNEEAGRNPDWDRDDSPRQTLQMIKVEACPDYNGERPTSSVDDSDPITTLTDLKTEPFDGKSAMEDHRFIIEEVALFQGQEICVENSTKVSTRARVKQQERIGNEAQDNKNQVDRYQSTKCSTEPLTSHYTPEQEILNRNAFLPMNEQGFSFENQEPFDSQSCSQWPARSGSPNKDVNAESVKPFQCVVCEKRFTHNCLLKYHQRMHTGEKPFRCKMCDHSFAQSSHLKAHQRTHTGEKPYQCKLCSQSFSRSRNLKAHQHTHTGKKPYKCEVCGKSFLRSDTLKTHQRTHTRTRNSAIAGWPTRASHSQSFNIHQLTHTTGTSYNDARCTLKPSCTV